MPPSVGLKVLYKTLPDGGGASTTMQSTVRRVIHRGPRWIVWLAVDSSRLPPLPVIFDVSGAPASHANGHAIPLA